jgi:hypothetical protein
MARVHREPCALDLNRPRQAADSGRRAPPTKRAQASARASRGQAIDPIREGNLMSHIDLLPRATAALPHAPPIPLDGTAHSLKTKPWNDTPDAIADCTACRPQSQQRRGLAPTTLRCEADHGQTTTNVTH